MVVRKISQGESTAHIQVVPNVIPNVEVKVVGQGDVNQQVLEKGEVAGESRPVIFHLVVQAEVNVEVEVVEVVVGDEGHVHGVIECGSPQYAQIDSFHE